MTRTSTRRIVAGCALVCACLAVERAAAQSGGYSRAPASAAADLSAYRAYASAQADMLVRMTKVIARDIGNGDVDAAQNDYAMTHRYLARIAPAAATLDRALDARMDASLEGDRTKTPEAAGVSGFHRLEHDLFKSRTTGGLSPVADRLHDDALLLQGEIATRPMPADVLIDGAVETIETVSARTLAEGSEPYARTELWDVEANLDGVQEIVAALRPRIERRDPLRMARVSAAFAKADERLSTFRAGCGFKSFDELSSAEKASLREATAALARELAGLRAVPAID